ncbi:MAG: serine/threonine-protein kinase [Chloroflexi bacterium]|nr:serine/threonine-protein kinase [Chloroflexota bacterium]
MNTNQLIGKKLAGNYRVDRFLGQGGMAQIFYGWDESLDRPVAIKVIGDALKDNTSYTERFIHEARAVAKWRHEHILQVYYAGAEANNLYYFVMEFLDGSDLEQVLRQYEEKGELIPFEDVIRIGRAIANALDYAHSKHVIHRDVKPSNILIDRENRIALTDFGLAMDIQRGSMGLTFGTPHYVAPEQARNSADAVPQSDFYSLGIILYEMLTGIVPFDDPSSMSVALKHLSEPPPPPRAINPHLSEEVERVLLKALSKEPGKRFANGQELMNALEDALRAQSETGKQSLVLPPLPSGVRLPQTPPRQVSRLSVFDNVRLSAPMPLPATAAPSPVYTPPPPPAPTPTPAAPPAKGGGMMPFVVGGVLFLLVVAAFFVFGGGAEDGGDGEPTAVAVASTAVPTTESSNTLIPTEASPTEASAPAQGSPTAVPVVETGPTDTPLPAPTEAPVVEVAPTETPPPPPPTDVPSAVPTIAFPDGWPIDLVYNDSSFYLYNGNDQRVRLGNFSFESLDAGGRPLRWFMEGNRWSQFYSFVDDRNCVAIEPFGPPGSYLKPSQCRSYNSTVTPTYTGDETFWLVRPEVAEFRVLWNGTEVGRCPLGENTCVVFIPAQ